MLKSNPDISDLSADETMMESRLLTVTPAATELNRDELMYQAGRRAARHATSRWQALAACLAGGLVLSLLLRTPSERHLARSTDAVPTQPVRPLPNPPQPNSPQLAIEPHDYSPYSLAMLRKLADDANTQDQFALPINSNLREQVPDKKPNLILRAHFTTLNGDQL